MRVHLHIGIPKTGNQFLINQCGYNRELLIQNGIFYNEYFYAILGYLKKYQFNDFIRKEFFEAFAVVKRMPEINTVVAISEALTGRVYGCKDIWKNRAKIFAELKRLFVDCDISISCCIRRQDEWVQSIYSQYVKEGGLSDFNQFIDSIMSFDYADYCSLADQLNDNFDNVTFIPYELAQNSTTAFVNSIFDLVKPDLNIQIKDENFNAGMPLCAVKAMQAYSQYASVEDVNKFRALISTHHQKQAFEPLNIITDQTRRQILQKYRKSNEKLFSTHNVLISPQIADYYLNDTDYQYNKLFEFGFRMNRLDKIIQNRFLSDVYFIRKEQ